MKFIFYVPNISIAEWIGLVISFFGTIATCVIAGYNIYFQKKIKKDEKRYRNEKFVEAIRMIAVKTDVIYQELPQKFITVFYNSSCQKDPRALLNDEHIEKIYTQISNLQEQISIEHKMLLSHLKTQNDFRLIKKLENILIQMTYIIITYKDITRNIYDFNKNELNLCRFVSLLNKNDKEQSPIKIDNIDRTQIFEILCKSKIASFTQKKETIDPLKLIFSLDFNYNDKEFKILDKWHNDLYSDKQIYKELDRIIEEI